MVRTIPVVVCLLLLSSLPASAELVDLGNGLIYDTVQDLTWMQDAWHSRSAGDASCSGGGRCFTSVEDAARWADSLVFAGLDDWRLPAYIPSRPPEFCPQFACGNGYSEISVMLQSLGWRWGFHPGSDRPDYMPGSAGPFVNFQATYWLGGADSFWWSRYEDVFLAGSASRAWAVRDGLPNYVRTPEPSTLLLIGVGAAMLRKRARRRAS